MDSISLTSFHTFTFKATFYAKKTCIPHNPVGAAILSITRLAIEPTGLGLEAGQRHEADPRSDWSKQPGHVGHTVAVRK